MFILDEFISTYVTKQQKRQHMISLVVFELMVLEGDSGNVKSRRILGRRK